MRIGIGYDIHKLVEGRKLILGGVDITFAKGLLGHSDADVLLHAISDAILGAAALGDIGKHFPDTDPKYKNADSRELLRNVVGLIKEKGFSIANIDTVIIAEKPKMAPHIEVMRKNIADDLGIDYNLVNVKATTNEGIGGVGREEAIAAQAITLLENQG
jgi:2-C-methyl-D-erythritol 2,4-cyclodiphosphate synthase